MEKMIKDVLKITIVVFALALPNLTAGRITYGTKQRDVFPYNKHKSTKLHKSNQHSFDGETLPFNSRKLWKNFGKLNQPKQSNDYGYEDAFQSQPDNGNYFDYNEGIGSMYRKSRPSLFEDSSIYYIKLPAVPYTFTPGLGYISPHPALPLSHQLHSSLALNPIVQLPFNFYSNGRPEGIFQVQNQRKDYFPYKMNGYRSQFFESPRTTNLKGDFSFNGRPDDIFIIPNSETGIRMLKGQRDSYNFDEY